MSSLPVDIFDPPGGFLYGLFGTRQSWAPGPNRRSATNSILPGDCFDRTPFTQATVQPGQPIPSVHDPTARAGDLGTDIGNVGHNVLRGPSQSNIDFSVGTRFSLSESKDLQVRADFVDLPNLANRDNPSDTGDCGQIVSFSSTSRIVRVSLKFNF